MPATKTQQAESSANGNGQTDPLAVAIAHEQAIAEEAAAIRKDATALTPTLYMELRALLRKPIPPALITTTEPVKGKPYESTGMRSLQVSIDRLDNVLTPFWWGYSYEYLNDGRLCHLRAWAGDKDAPMIDRESWGGVNQGSTEGNIYKGSFTNTAKRGFAEAFGVGHEIYLGATDFDPDTDKAAAKLQTQTPSGGAQTIPTIDGDRVAALTDLAQAWVTAVEGDEQKKRTTQITRLLRAEGLTGEIKTVTAGFARLTPVQGDNVETWLREQSKAGGSK